jgi:dTMP kinase
LFEGIDRCGKSTQSSLLAQVLSLTAMTELIRFPDRTSTIGSLINSYLASTTNMSDEAIHLLFSANRWEAAQDLENKLRGGTNLVSCATVKVTSDI